MISAMYQCVTRLIPLMLLKWKLAVRSAIPSLMPMSALVMPRGHPQALDLARGQGHALLARRHPAIDEVRHEDVVKVRGEQHDGAKRAADRRLPRPVDRADR